MTRPVLLLAAAMIVHLLPPAPAAEARIACQNGFQATSSGLIATPYCQDELVAAVAREHGMRVSGAAVRNNPNLKRNVCQFVGRDIRIQQACVDANSVGRRGF